MTEHMQRARSIVPCYFEWAIRKQLDKIAFDHQMKTHELVERIVIDYLENEAGTDVHDPA